MIVRHFISAYSSFLLAGLAAKSGNAVDALVLTGFTTSTQSVSVTIAALGMALASQVDKVAFGTYPCCYQSETSYRPMQTRTAGSLSNSYMAIANPLNLQQAFLRSPSFPAGTLPTLLPRLTAIFTRLILRFDRESRRAVRTQRNLYHRRIAYPRTGLASHSSPVYQPRIRGDRR